MRKSRCPTSEVITTVEGLYLQSTNREQPNETETLSEWLLQSPETRNGDCEYDEVREQASCCDDIANGVLIDAFAVGNRFIPEIGDRSAWEHDRDELGKKPCNQEAPGCNECDPCFLWGEDPIIEEQKGELDQRDGEGE